MNPALVFILLALAMLVVVTLVLCLTLWRGSQRGAYWASAQTQAAHNPAQANAAVYRDQMADLDREYVLGNLNHAELKVARDELAQRLLADVDALEPQDNTAPASATATTWRKPWWALAAMAVVVVASSLLGYSVLGQPAALDPRVVAQGLGVLDQAQDNASPEKLSEMAQALARKLQDEPQRMEGWVMLARVQRARGMFQESADAFGKALALSRDDDLSIERAEVLAQSKGGSFAGEPWAVIRRVLKGDPRHVNALFLAGSASFSEEKFKDALGFWERARRVVPADSPDAPELDRAIALSREKLGLAPAAVAAALGAANQTTGEQEQAKSTARRISGRVSLDPALAASVAPSDTVFVYATAVSGSRMPVAIVKASAQQLPLDFVLDDSTAMNPSVKLSGLDAVTLRVRISKSGQATPQAGDFGVSQSPVKTGSQGLRLVVKEALPNTP